MIPMGSSHVNDHFVGQNKNFDGVSFGIDGDGNYGYYGADGSLVPFKKGECQLVSIGTIGGNGSVFCSCKISVKWHYSYSNYHNNYY